MPPLSFPQKVAHARCPICCGPRNMYSIIGDSACQQHGRQRRVFVYVLTYTAMCISQCTDAGRRPSCLQACVLALHARTCVRIGQRPQCMQSSLIICRLLLHVHAEVIYMDGYVGKERLPCLADLSSRSLGPSCSCKLRSRQDKIKVQQQQTPTPSP